MLPEMLMHCESLQEVAVWQAALKPKGSNERLLLVAAFAQSAFQAVGKLKCMVPMMGETYEVCAGISFSMVAAHHSLWPCANDAVCC